MAKINWMDILEWGEEQLEDLRTVGYAYIKQGEYDVALTFFKALQILSPNNAYDLQTLGAIHLQLGKNLEALNFIDQSLSIEPNNYHALLNRAKALFSLGYKKQGILQAKELLPCKVENIASLASALIMTYS